jgi:hypothetical protein
MESLDGEVARETQHFDDPFQAGASRRRRLERVE